jgi:hypothetical protein
LFALAARTKDVGAVVAPREGVMDMAKEKIELVDWQGRYGGNVDGWWAPEEGKEAVLEGYLINFIDKDRSDKLQSNSLVFELAEGCEGCKNGGSTAMPGEKGDDKVHKAPAGCIIGVPEWKQIEGLWPRKAGFYAKITRSAHKMDVGGGHKMYTFKVQTSTKALRHVEIYDEPMSTGGGAEQTQFKVDTTS